MASAKPRMEVSGVRSSCDTDRSRWRSRRGPLQALRHAVDGAGQRHELGIVVGRPARGWSSSPTAMRPVTSIASTRGRAMRRLICQATRAAMSSAARRDDEVPQLGPSPPTSCVRRMASVPSKSLSRWIHVAPRRIATPAPRRRPDSPCGPDRLARLERGHIDVPRCQAVGQRRRDTAEAVDRHKVRVFELEDLADGGEVPEELGAGRGRGEGLHLGEELALGVGAAPRCG